MKMEAESIKGSLEVKDKLLKAIKRENEEFQRIASILIHFFCSSLLVILGESRKLLQETMKHETVSEVNSRHSSN